MDYPRIYPKSGTEVIVTTQVQGRPPLRYTGKFVKAGHLSLKTSPPSGKQFYFVSSDQRYVVLRRFAGVDGQGDPVYREQQIPETIVTDIRPCGVLS